MNKAGEFVNSTIFLNDLPKCAALNGGVNFLWTNMHAGYCVEKLRPICQNEAQTRFFPESVHPTFGMASILGSSISGWDESQREGNVEFGKSIQKPEYSASGWRYRHIYQTGNHVTRSNVTFFSDIGISQNQFASGIEIKGMSDPVPFSSARADISKLPTVFPCQSYPVPCDITCTQAMHYKACGTEFGPTVYLGKVLRSNYRQDWRFNSDRWAMVSALCHEIEQICGNSTNAKTKETRAKTIFHASPAPEITLIDYLRRITWFFDCPKECFVLTLEYLHRVTKCKKELQLNYNTVHKLVITCIKVATKFFDDVFFNSSLYAKVVGLPAATVAALEVQLLFFLSFDLYVSLKQYRKRYDQMLSGNKGPSKVTMRPWGI